MSDPITPPIPATVTDAQLAEWDRLASQATAGPWACEMRMTDGQRGGDVHYSLFTAYNHHDHPHSPRFIAWFCGAVVTDAGAHVRKSGARVVCDRPGCNNWRYATREVGVDLRRDPQIEADGKFLAAAREAVPELVAEVRRQRFAVEVACADADRHCQEIEDVVARGGWTEGLRIAHEHWRGVRQILECVMGREWDGTFTAPPPNRTGPFACDEPAERQQ